MILRELEHRYLLFLFSCLPCRRFSSLPCLFGNEVHSFSLPSSPSAAQRLSQCLFVCLRHGCCPPHTRFPKMPYPVARTGVTVESACPYLSHGMPFSFSASSGGDAISACFPASVLSSIFSFLLAFFPYLSQYLLNIKSLRRNVSRETLRKLPFRNASVHLFRKIAVHLPVIN